MSNTKYIRSASDERFVGSFDESFRIQCNYSQERYEALNEQASKIPMPKSFGGLTDEKIYLDSVDLLLASSCEREHKAEILFRKVLQKLYGCQSMLDIGVGNGDLTKYFAPYCSDITVVDSRQASLDNIPNKLGNQNAEVIKTHADILTVNFTKKYDFIILSHVLYYVPTDDRERLLDKLYDSLSPRGKILIIFNDGLGREELASRFNGITSNFSGITENIKDKHHSIGTFSTTETMKTNTLTTMLHVAGVILNDASIEVPKDDLADYLKQHCYRGDHYEMDMTQHIMLLGHCLD